jgi:Flp pilus assembly protein TadG
MMRERLGMRGQAIAEFAVVLPILFFLLFGVMEGGLLMFSVGTARIAAGEAARQLSESGNAANADQVTLQVIRNTAMGTTNLSVVNHVDFYRLIENANGSFTVDNSKYNKYNLDGSNYSGWANTWPSSSRNVINGQSDFIGVTIYYTYNWKSGLVLAQPPLALNQSFYVRLEPQTY